MSRALVVGGSVAGLLAARVLDEWFDEVDLVEADELPAGAGPRTGIAHGDQLHVLLTMAQELLDGWFPGIVDRVAADGTVRCGAGEARMLVDGVARPPAPGLVPLPVRRWLLESHLRREVLPRPGVRLFRERVVGLIADAGRVHGVRLASGREITGVDLVVDASGRGTRIGEWLRGIGHRPPPKRRLNLDLGYATALFHRSPDQRLDDLRMVHSIRSVDWAPPGVGVLAPVAPDRWVCGISGYGADRPTADPAEFRRRCLGEPAPAFAELVRRCAPAGPVAVHRFPHALRRDFHLAQDFPAGLVAVGDTVVSCNPVYGQGVPSAALHAGALHAWLRAGAGGDLDSADFFARLRVLADAVWQVAAIEDTRLPHVTGDRPRGLRALHAVSSLVSRAARTDDVVAREFTDVVNMRSHPSALSRPGILGRAVLAEARSRFTR
ncbi:FAD-dependent oxidoreductase [Actinokineospora spheciospongiae]|uniref:FAD-dependent oxidoreductase n=1 Tax=Actinokineospora spheciospongiae TaxID=909613 RepID=UPI000D719141|nr:hypothetical protein [Actinokineospora spheciospongiae]